MTPSAAAAGSAAIDAVGNRTGFASAFIVGMIEDATGSTDAGPQVIAASLVITASMVPSFKRTTVDR